MFILRQAGNIFLEEGFRRKLTDGQPPPNARSIDTGICEWTEIAEVD
jgi:hypothetical protein